MKTTIQSLSLLQILLIAYGLYLLAMADNAMNKAGIGNIELWNEYNTEAGVVVIFAAFLWLVSLSAAIYTKKYILSAIQAAIAVPPMLFFVGWVLLWFI